MYIYCYTAHHCLTKSPLTLCAQLALRAAGFLYVLPPLGWHVQTINPVIYRRYFYNL